MPFFQKTAFTSLYLDALQEELKEEASPTSISPTDMTAAFKELMTAEKKASPTPSSNLWTKRVEVFAKSEGRRHYLELLNSALSTVPPTACLCGG